MANSRVTRAEIIQMAEDSLRQIYAAQGLDFEAEKARRMLTNANVGGGRFQGRNARKC